MAAVVVRVRLVDEENLSRTREDGAIVARPELDDACVAVSVRVVDVEEPVPRVRRAECNGEKTALAAAADAGADVEQRSGNPAAEDVTDPAGLLDDVKTIWLTRSTATNVGPSKPETSV
jgi:hypothetical protein